MPPDDAPPTRSRPLTAPERAGGTELLEPGPLADPGRDGRHEVRDPERARLASRRPEAGTRIGPPRTLDRARRLGRRVQGVPARELIAGGALTLVGIGLLLGWVVHLSWTPLVDLALIVTGVVLVVQARRSTASRPLIALAVVLAIVAAATWRADVTLDGGLGRRTVTPTSAAPVSYQLGTGQLTIDLRRTPASGDALRVRADVGIGRILVRVPKDAVVTTRAVAGGGATFVLGTRHGGPGVDELATAAGTGAVQADLDLHVGIGSVEVRRG